jgi:hypothetical protein
MPCLHENGKGEVDEKDHEDFRNDVFVWTDAGF